MTENTASFEWRVVNAQDGGSPSVSFATELEARDAATRRLERWPEDGPQKVQCRRIGAWENAGTVGLIGLSVASSTIDRPEGENR